jgi:hypothetical protein
LVSFFSLPTLSKSFIKLDISIIDFYVLFYAIYSVAPQGRGAGGTLQGKAQPGTWQVPGNGSLFFSSLCVSFTTNSFVSATDLMISCVLGIFITSFTLVSLLIPHLSAACQVTLLCKRSKFWTKPDKEIL